jgi:HEAT repeat protein
MTLGEPPSTSELLRRALALSRSDPEDESDARWEAIMALHGRPEEAVAQAALAWCRSADAAERRLGIDILAQLGLARPANAEPPFRAVSLPVLEHLLTDPDPHVVGASLVALHHLGPSDSLDRIIALATHPSEDVRHSVAVALLAVSEPRAIRTLIGLSSDSASHVRDWATFGLGAQIEDDSPEIRDALLARAEDADPDTRAEAFAGLAKRHDPRVLVHLQSALRQPSVGTLDVEAALDLADPALLPALEALVSWWDVDPPLLQDAIEQCRRGGDGAATRGHQAT